MPNYTMKQYKEKIDRWMKQYPKDAQIALHEAATKVMHEVQSKHLAGPKMAQGEGSKTKGTLQMGSGALLGSISVMVSRAGHRMNAHVGTFKRQLKYARIHEYGGIIKPKEPGGLLRFKIGNAWISKKQVTIPERSYLRSSLKAKRKAVVETLLAAIKRSYNNV
jgi:phage gpG-like protein